MHKEISFIQTMSSNKETLAEMAVDGDSMQTLFTSQRPPVMGDGLVVDLGKEYLISSINTVEGALEHCTDGGCVWELGTEEKQLTVLSPHYEQPERCVIASWLKLDSLRNAQLDVWCVGAQ